MSIGMPETAPPAVPTPTTAPHPRARPIPRKIKDAIEAMQSGKARNLTQAAKCAGISRVHVSRTLSRRPDIVTWADNRARRMLALGVSVAVPKILSLVHSSSQRVAFEASRHVLAVAGIQPPSDSPSVSVSVELKAGYVIDLSEHSATPPQHKQTTIEANADDATTTDE